MEAVSITKRRRIVEAQSRIGCYTCKSRRIKCDETRPTCLRCRRSCMPCEGYRDQSRTTSCDTEARSSPGISSALFSSGVSPMASPMPSISGDLGCDREQRRLAILARMTLEHGAAAISESCNTVIAVSLPRLSHSVPCVAIALASLGAALEASTVDEPSRALARTVVVKHYGSALCEIKKEISSLTPSREPLVLACFLLACTEIVQWREEDALTHVHGSMAILRSWQTSKSYSSSLPHHIPTEPLEVSCEQSYFTPKDELDLFSVQLDIVVASYALAIPPSLPQIDMEYLLSLPPTERRQSDLELEITEALHSCYRVAHSITEFKYLKPDVLPARLAYDQARNIAQLVKYLGILEKHLKQNTSTRHPAGSSNPSRKSILILHSQCLAGLIYLSMISKSRECEYDTYAIYFQKIIADGEALLFQETSRNENDLPTFTIGLGILQPLFFVALKYRHPLHRRRATALLRRGGREGPFDGCRLFAVASRAIDVEESYAVAHGRTVLVAADIAERERLHGIGVDVEAMAGVGDYSKVDLTLSLCVDLEGLLQTGQWKDSQYWNMWTERLDVYNKSEALSMVV